MQLRNSAVDIRDKRQVKSDTLYWERRYRNGSYKSRKAHIQPILMTARCGGDRLRVYGLPDDIRACENGNKIAKGIFKGWRAKERERRRLGKNRRHP